MSDYLQQANPDWAMNQLRDAQERIEALEKQVLDLISAMNIAPPDIENPAQGYSGADVMLSIDTATKIITITPWGGNKVGVLENDFLTTRILNDPVTYDASGAAVDKYIDVYLAYDMVAEIWVADISVWTDDTTRSEAQTVIEGITVLASDHSQRFLGIARIPTVGDPFIGGGGDVTWGGAVDGATAGHVAVFADITGKVILDGGSLAPGSGIVTKVLTSQFDKTSDTTLEAVTGLSVNVVAGNTYVFQCVLQTTEGGVGGVKFSINGTCAASLFAAGAFLVPSVTSLGDVILSAEMGAPAEYTIEGTITVSSSGTLYPEFAQSISNGTASSVLVGSSFTLVSNGLGGVSPDGQPGGADGDVQINDAGAFYGDANFHWDKAGQVLSLTGKLSVSVPTGYGEMYMYDNVTACAIDTANVYHAIYNSFGNNDGTLAPLRDATHWTYKAGVAYAITAFADYNAPTSTITEVTTSGTHALLAGEPVTITGTTNYNGTYLVLAVTATTKFTITKVYAGNDATGSVRRPATMKCLVTGYYRASFNFSGIAANTNDVFKWELNKNVTPLDNIVARSIWTSGANNYRSVSANGLVSLTAGQYVWASVKNYSGTGDLTFNSGNVVFHMVK